MTLKEAAALRVGDRVMRRQMVGGVFAARFGTVQDIRPYPADSLRRMHVLWDDGVWSVVGPSSIEKVR